MSLYTPVFPPSLECKSIGHIGAPSSSVEILRDIHLFLATKPEVLAPSSRPSSPSFEANVDKLKLSVIEAIDAARGDTGSGKWREVNEKLRMGCVRGRYRMTGLKQGWRPPQYANWILPDDEETWFKLEKERAEARRLKGKAKSSCHPDDVPVASVTPFRGLDMVDTASLVEIVDMRETVSPKTMRNVTKKVARWRATITTDGANPVQRSTSMLDLEGKTLAKIKNQTSSLGFPVVKRNATTVAGKKGEGYSNRTPLPDLLANGFRSGDHAPNVSKASAAQERQIALRDGETDRAICENPLLVLDGELPKITDFPETPYIPPSFPSQLETSTPPPRDIAVSMRKKPSPIHPVSPSLSILNLSIPKSDDQQDSCGDPRVIDSHSSPPLHPNDLQSNKRPLPHHETPSTPKKRRVMSSPEENPASHPRLATPSPDELEVEKSQHPTSPRSEGRLPTLTELLAASPCPKVRSRPLLEDILLVENQSEPSSRPNPAKEHSPAKSYFLTPGGSVPSDSPTSAHNLLIHSPLSPMLSFAQNPDAFLPQFTSTQAEGSRSKGTSKGNFGVGYSSQFDVERHVDRVSELLEKDVDFNGWLRDAETAEEQEDGRV